MLKWLLVSAKVVNKKNILILFLLLTIFLVVYFREKHQIVRNDPSNQLTHYRWDASGRTFTTGNPNQYIYKSEIGQKNIKLAGGTYAPYIWDEQNKIIKFANSSIHLNGNKWELWDNAKKVHEIAFSPEIKKDGQWQKEYDSISDIRVEEIKTNGPTDYIELTYNLETTNQVSTISLKVGGSANAQFAFDTQAKQAGEYRLAIRQDSAGLKPVYSSNNKSQLLGYQNPKSGFYWKWQENETTHYIEEKPNKLALLVNEDKYLAGGKITTFPDQWGATAIQADADDGDETVTPTNVWNSNGVSGGRIYLVCDASFPSYIRYASFRWTPTITGTVVSIDSGTQIFLTNPGDNSSPTVITWTLKAHELNDAPQWADSAGNRPSDHWSVDMTTNNYSGTGQTGNLTQAVTDIVSELAVTDAYTYNGSKGMNFVFYTAYVGSGKWWSLSNDYGGTNLATLAIVYTVTTPNATSVSDYPDLVTVDSANPYVTFTGGWSESDSGDLDKMYVCKDSSCTNCNNTSQANCWCYSSIWNTQPDTSDTCTYTAQAGDVGANSYWLGVCDDEPSCDATPLSGGTFSVNTLAFKISASSLQSISARGSSSISFQELAAGGQAIYGLASSSTSYIAKAGIIYQMFGTTAGTLTLTLDDGGQIAFGTLSYGTKKTGTTRLKVAQTGATSLNITAGRQRANLTPATLASNAAPNVVANQIDDDAGGIDIFNGLTNCATAGSHPAVWPTTTGVSTGLGFTNWADSNSSKDTSCWGTGTTATDANNRYAVLQASNSASSFISISSSPPATLYVSVGYGLEIRSIQKATTYTGGVVFTATAAP